MQTADIIPSCPMSDYPQAGLSLVTGAQFWPLIGRKPILYLGSLQPVVRLLITSPGLIANVKTISRIFGNVQVSVRLDFYSTSVQLLSCKESIMEIVGDKNRNVVLVSF